MSKNREGHRPSHRRTPATPHYTILFCWWQTICFASFLPVAKKQVDGYRVTRQSGFIGTGRCPTGWRDEMIPNEFTACEIYAGWTIAIYNGSYRAFQNGAATPWFNSRAATRRCIDLLEMA
jgi:hypothetical protein